MSAEKIKANQDGLDNTIKEINYLKREKVLLLCRDLIIAIADCAASGIINNEKALEATDIVFSVREYV